MTKDRVRQLAEQLYIDVPDSPSADPDKTLAIFERAILAALDESWGEEPSEEMYRAGYSAFLHPVGGTADVRIWRAMSAVRRAALQSSKPEG